MNNTDHTQRKNFITINEAFLCKNCGHENPKHKTSCRNHCQKCLFSLHVDKTTPGDRQSTCQSLMQPISATQDGKKGWLIYHKCLKCKKIIPNKAAEDDDFNKLIEISQNPLEIRKNSIKIR